MWVWFPVDPNIDGALSWKNIPGAYLKRQRCFKDTFNWMESLEWTDTMWDLNLHRGFPAKWRCDWWRWSQGTVPLAPREQLSLLTWSFQNTVSNSKHWGVEWWTRAVVSAWRCLSLVRREQEDARLPPGAAHREPRSICLIEPWMPQASDHYFFF